MSYRTIILPQAVKMLKAIADRRVREKIIQRIDGLAEEPLQQGKPLLGPLMGYRSLRAVGQRYRIIYRVEEDQVLVLVGSLWAFVSRVINRIFMPWPGNCCDFIL